jgi:GTP cyclohydrolase I
MGLDVEMRMVRAIARAMERLPHPAAAPVFQMVSAAHVCMMKQA